MVVYLILFLIEKKPQISDNIYSTQVHVNLVRTWFFGGNMTYYMYYL